MQYYNFFFRKAHDMPKKVHHDTSAAAPPRPDAEKSVTLSPAPAPPGQGPKGGGRTDTETLL